MCKKLKKPQDIIVGYRPWPKLEISGGGGGGKARFNSDGWLGGIILIYRRNRSRIPETRGEKKHRRGCRWVYWIVNSGSYTTGVLDDRKLRAGTDTHT